MSTTRSNSVASWIGLLGSVTAVLCSPPVAARILALEPLHPEDLLPLWIFSITLFAASAAIAFGEFRWRENLAAALLPLLVLIGLEAGARTLLRFVGAETRRELALLARRTHRDQMAFQPHPFLQFTGKPGSVVQDQGFGIVAPFNALGFHGPDLPKAKPPGTIRIACLGASTTADGYPLKLERLLLEQIAPGQSVEAMNFGLGWYTSAHSLVNFVLNVQDYSPDYVVFLHAINEGRGRGRFGGVRSDYTHLVKPFEYPRIRDAYLIRASVIYRYLEQKITGTPYWAFLDAAVVRESESRGGEPFADLSDLDPYERNIKTILDLALLRGTTPVLATQPYSTDPATQVTDYTEHLEQSNELMRRLAEEYAQAESGRVLFVDLDRLFTGRNDLFDDMVHMTDRGVEKKAEAIAGVILVHLREAGANDNTAESPGDEVSRRLR